MVNIHTSCEKERDPERVTPPNFVYKRSLTLGSLFDGSGGFPLAGLTVGVRPLWASEIEPFPIRVTKKNLPMMEHVGDVRCLHGSQLEPVDILTFGSPCTDLSNAGKRVGIQGEASGLFFEAIRIVKEMREATNGQYPRYCVWENVPGAFSTNGGQDFRSVLSSFAHVCDSEAPDIPMPKNGRWARSGAIVGDGYSIAWRVLDAQYFGVPQRRKRIFLVCDFGTEHAGEILFERRGLPLSVGKAEARTKSRDVSFDGRSCIKASSVGTYHKERRNSLTVCPTNIAGTLDCKTASASCNQTKTLVYGVSGRTLQSPSVDAYGCLTISSELSPTLTASNTGGVCDTIGTHVRVFTPLECCRLQGFPDYWCEDTEVKNPSDEELSFWRGVWDRWCDLRGVKRRSEKQICKWLASPPSDTAMYKLWGNGVALPCVAFVMGRIVSLDRV